jgi:hypothetical protein
MALENRSLRVELEPYLKYEDLPVQLKTDERYYLACERRALWIDERSVVDVSADSIKGTIHVQMEGSDADVASDNGDTFFIAEIIYHRFSHHLCTRPATNRHLLTSEVFKPQLPPNQDLPILKVFLDIYIDDFGPYRSVYHALGGVYLVLGNMPLEMRQELRNIFLIGFIPFGVDFNEWIRPVVDEIASLQQGVIWELNEVRYWVIAGMSFDDFCSNSSLRRTHLI